MFARILVGIEFPHERRQIALARATALARVSGARLTLFHSVYNPYATARGASPSIVAQGIRDTVAERRAALEKLAIPLRRRGLRVTTRAVWDYPAFEAIVREVLRSRPDLVVAESRRRVFGARLFLTNTDWQLIRLCPASLLFVKQPRAGRRLRVLAAVDPLHAYDKPARLDRRILEVAQALARSHAGSLDVVHALAPPLAFWPGVHGEAIALPGDPEAERRYERRARRRLERTVAPFGLSSNRLHVDTGPAHMVLPAVARRLRANVLAMGAVSRQGLDRLIIGSTAERVLDRAACDVLVVKPRRFRTPVPRRSLPPRTPLPPG